MLSLCALFVVGATVVEDTPRGADLVARVELGRLAPDLRAGWGELEPLFAAWPALGAVAREHQRSLVETIAKIEKASGADLDEKGAVATFVADIDATGGAAWAVVIRGAAPARAEGNDFLVDDQPAHRIDSDLAWAVIGDVLIAGNERGLQRQVRQVLGKPEVDEPIVTRARRLRGRAPIQVVFESPMAVRADLEGILPNVGPLVAAVAGGTLVASPGRLWMQLSAEDEEGQQATEHGVRAFVALMRASTALLRGGAEAIVGLDLLGARPNAVPADLETGELETLAENWLDKFTVDAELRRRRPHVIEAELKLSSYRGLVAALGVMAVMVVPTTAGPQAEAEVLLELLRRAQLAHHARTGEYVSCGPVPESLPAGPMPWPKSSCFDAIGFAPPADVRFQLVAGVEEGELVLMARGDTDGDGVAEIWVLEGNAVAVRPLLPSP